MQTTNNIEKVHKATPLSKAVEGGDVLLVGELSELFNKPFGPKANVVCLPRNLKGDFNAVAGFLQDVLFNKSANFGEAEFEAYARQMKGAVAVAAQNIMDDFKIMRDSGCRKVILRVVNDDGYDENDSSSEGVHLFHTDGGSPEKGRVLTCYTVAATEGLANNDAACMRDLDDFDVYGENLYHEQKCFYGGLDSFLDFLYAQRDGHYVPLEGKKPFAFGLGDIWRQATDDNKDKVAPFIHRAPRTRKGALPRLLMVGDY